MLFFSTCVIHRCYLISALLCLGATVRAQTTFPLSILVVDQATDAPVAFANVYVRETNGGGQTDAAGLLELRLPEGTSTFVTSVIGYTSDTSSVRLPAEDRLTVALRPAAATLSAVTVNADRDRARLKGAVLGVERLDYAEIQELPAVLGEVDVLRGLQQAAGVTSAGEASNGLSVRGGTIDQNLMLLDDAPIFTPTHLFGLFSVFPPDALESVNLYRGNIPARFGGRIASIVDVRTRNPRADKFRLQGGLGLVSSRLAVEGPLSKDGRFSGLATARLSVNDFAFRYVDDLENTRGRFGDAFVRLRHVLNDRNDLVLKGFYSRDFYQLDLVSEFNNIIAESNQYDYGTLNGSLEWLMSIGNRTSLETKLIRASHTPQLLFPERGSANTVRYQSSIRQSELRSTLRKSGDRHDVAGGVQLTHYALDPGALDPGASAAINALTLPRENGAELSLYIDDDWSVTERLTVSAGLRYTQFLRLGPGTVRRYREGEEIRRENFVGAEDLASGQVMASYGAFEPRLGASLQLGDNVWLKAAYAHTRQYLQNIFNATTPLPTSRWVLSDENILPQRADLYSGGVYWSIDREKGYEVSLEGYLRQTDNLLDYKPGAEFFLDRSVETELLQGTGESYGVELAAAKRRGILHASVNYTYARALARVDGPTFFTSINQGEAFANNFDIPHSFKGSMTVDDGEHHRAGVTFVAHSNRPFTKPSGVIDLGDATVPQFTERNNARMPTYHRLDFSWTVYNAGMKKRRWVGEWTLTAYNLYGRRNANNIFYQPRRISGDSEVFLDAPLASYKLSIFGVPLVSLSYGFKFE